MNVAYGFHAVCRVGDRTAIGCIAIFFGTFLLCGGSERAQDGRAVVEALQTRGETERL